MELVALDSVSNHLKNESEFDMDAVKQNGTALEYAPYQFKNEIELVELLADYLPAVE